MMVKVGFNTDYGKDKFDVGLDETDLARLLAEAGIPPDAQLTALEAFQVLHAEAERFCAAKRAAVEPDKAGHWKQEARRLGEQVATQLGKITVRPGLEPDEQ
jgi:hypothetical protein